MIRYFIIGDNVAEFELLLTFTGYVTSCLVLSVSRNQKMKINDDLLIEGNETIRIKNKAGINEYKQQRSNGTIEQYQTKSIDAVTRFYARMDEKLTDYSRMEFFQVAENSRLILGS